jgi:hypothetical protein
MALPGCANIQLRRSTVNQASTLTDLQYQQVLNNLAMFCANPSALPWHINLRDGSAQVVDSGSASVLLDWHRAIVSHPTLMGSRTVVEQWGMSPVTDDIELKLLRIAYRRAIGFDESLEDDEREFANDLAHELKKQTPDLDDFRGDIDKAYEEKKNKVRAMTGGDDWRMIFPTGVYEPFNERALSLIDERIIPTADYEKRELQYIWNQGYDDAAKLMNPNGIPIEYVTPDAAEVRRQVKAIQRDLLQIPVGWYGVGRKRDVPRDACFVGHYNDCYVWVCPDGREGLTQFTLKILSFSSLIKDTTTLTIPGPRFTPANSLPR